MYAIILWPSRDPACHRPGAPQFTFSRTPSTPAPFLGFPRVSSHRSTGSKPQTLPEPQSLGVTCPGSSTWVRPLGAAPGPWKPSERGRLPSTCARKDRCRRAGTERGSGGIPGWLSHLALLSALGMTPGSRDQVLHRASCVEPASPSACVSASLSLSLSVSLS